VSVPFDADRPGAASAGACPLCGVAVPEGTRRCGSCGCDLAGVAGGAGPFSRAALWLTVAAVLAVYVLTLLIVLAAR
jgi:hypothetical protein